MSAAYDPVIGLEIHVQLATRTKMFCGDLAQFGGEPNTRVCPVCLGLPGALPVANGKAVELAVRAAVALGCDVHEDSVFARKNYFYPDLPKGYQITQYDRPLATGGWLRAGGEKVRIRRIHLEEDAGRSLHDRLPGRTAVDLNRAGVPLIEIVTEPDLAGPAQARLFLTRLKRLLQYVEVSDCDMEKGSLRVDANLSLRSAGTRDLGTHTEVKNMNSFAAVERALEFEAGRQAAILDAGRRVVHETLLWDGETGEARPMRSKESSRDYRYFPDPDLPPLRVDADEVTAIRESLPELPDAREARFERAYGLPGYDAGVLTASPAVADYFEAVAVVAGDAKAASNWVMTGVLGWLNENGGTITDFPIPASRLGELVSLVGDGTVSSTMARVVFGRMAETGRTAPEIIAERGLAQVTDQRQLAQWVAESLAEHPREAARLEAGEIQLVGFFMGYVMAHSKGKADPKRAAELLRGISAKGTDR